MKTIKTLQIKTFQMPSKSKAQTIKSRLLTRVPEIEFKRESLRETSYKQGGNCAKILELGR